MQFCRADFSPEQGSKQKTSNGIRVAAARDSPLLLVSPAHAGMDRASQKRSVWRDAFPGAGFGAETPPKGLLCCLTKLCIILPSMAVKKKTVQRSLDLLNLAK